MDGIAWLLPLSPDGRPFLDVTSGYGKRTTPAGEQFHAGIDLRAELGTPIVAVRPGKVHRIDGDGVGKGGINGNAVFLSCSGFLVCYLHLSVVGCAVGDDVIPGQWIGRTGATGRSRGAHLHFQVYAATRTTVDPATLYPSGWLRPVE